MHNFIFFGLCTLELWSILSVIKSRKSSHKSGLSAPPSRTFSKGSARLCEEKQRDFNAQVIHQGMATLFIVKGEIHWRLYSANRGISDSKKDFVRSNLSQSVKVAGVKAQGKKTQKIKNKKNTQMSQLDDGVTIRQECIFLCLCWCVWLLWL